MGGSKQPMAFFFRGPHFRNAIMTHNGDKGVEAAAEPREGESPEGRIESLRKVIDNIDLEVLSLLNRRILLGKEIGKVKKLRGTQVLDSARESKVMQRLFAANSGPLSNSALHHIYKEIISASRDIQKSLCVSYLGPEATFTHMAAINHFGRSVTFSAQASIADVFATVGKGTCNYGVVPVENSIEGSVNHTLDLFFDSDLKICAEINYPVSYDLLSRGGVLSEIEVVYAVPQSFSQCRRWLAKHLPNVRMEESSNTAHAARKAFTDSRCAAIAGREAALMFNLEVAASRIEDIARNSTRFLAVGKTPPGRTADDLTSIMFTTAHTPGALYRVLKPLAEAEINMVKLVSRPASQEGWSYFFFSDVEGHIEDENVSRAVEKMKAICPFLKWLGSYPRATA
jgi:chorismate mutase/prephenate dehydratase